jgi:hypothetical protein
MPTQVITPISVTTGQKPAAADWNAWLNAAINYINGGIDPGQLKVGGDGRPVLDIHGDALTVGGMTPAQIQGGQQPGVLKTMADMIFGTAHGVVMQGGVATKDGTQANKLDITAVTVLQRVTSTGYIDRVDLAASSVTTSLASTTYYLYVVPAATSFGWSTAAPTGDYVMLAQVSTDGSGNISTVTDQRPLAASLFSGYGLAETISSVSGTITGSATWSAEQLSSVTGTAKTGLLSLLGSAFRLSATSQGSGAYAAITWGTSPAAGIIGMSDGSGGHLYFGTSNNYSNGITNTAMAVDPSGNVSFGGQIQSTLPTNTAPFSPASTTLCPNLNAERWGGAKNDITTVSGGYTGGTSSSDISTGIGTSIAPTTSRVLARATGYGGLSGGITGAAVASVYRSATGIPAAGSAPGGSDVRLGYCNMGSYNGIQTALAIEAIDTGLTPGTTYYYYFAQNNGNNGAAAAVLGHGVLSVQSR